MQALCARSGARARKGGAAEVTRRARGGPTQRKPEVELEKDSLAIELYHNHSYHFCGQGARLCGCFASQASFFLRDLVGLRSHLLLVTAASF